jgi:hypothetical protein
MWLGATAFTRISGASKRAGSSRYSSPFNAVRNDARKQHDRKSAERINCMPKHDRARERNWVSQRNIPKVTTRAALPGTFTFRRAAASWRHS